MEKYCGPVTPHLYYWMPVVVPTQCNVNVNGKEEWAEREGRQGKPFLRGGFWGMGRTCSIWCNVDNNIEHGLRSSLFWPKTPLRSRFRDSERKTSPGTCLPFSLLPYSGWALPVRVLFLGSYLCPDQSPPTLIISFSPTSCDLNSLWEIRTWHETCYWGKCAKCLQLSVYEEIISSGLNSLGLDWLPCLCI